MKEIKAEFEPNEELEMISNAVAAMLLEYGNQKGGAVGLALPPYRAINIEFVHNSSQEPVRVDIHTERGTFRQYITKRRILTAQQAALWTWAQKLSARVSIGGGQ